MKAGSRPRPAIRPAEPGDVALLAELAGQLGYPTEPGQMARRLTELPEGDEVFVAVVEGAVVGWMHTAVHRTLVLDPFLEVMALVVAEGRRGRGVGRELMAVAEASARAANLSTIRLRSNVVREEAHAFYRGLGYREEKRSALFVKELSR